MLDKRTLLALNGVDDVYLEETAVRLGYITDDERIVPMKNYRKLISVLIAAALLLSLGIAAYATDIFGIRAMQIKENAPEPVRGPEGGYLSITQPQDVPEEMSADVKAKIENSTKAWAEWDAWRRENGISQPEVFTAPDGFSGTLEITENENGTYTLIFSKPVPVCDDENVVIDVKYEEVERRIATAEEYEQDMMYMEAISRGFEGYDYNYHVYTQEMADKLESIAASYGLKLRHEKILMLENFGDFTDYNSFDEICAKINEVCAGGESFFRTLPTGYDKFYYFDEGTFAISFFTTEDMTNLGTSCYLYNSPYGTLSSGFEIIGEVKDISGMATYIHTTPDGTEVTVLHNGADMFAYTYLENSFVSMYFHQTNGLSPDEINAIIDMVDFSTIK